MSQPVEQLDVLIIGAGISGIGAAYYLQRDHPAKTYTVLEARDGIGGTWDLFRYPGIRSDSDLFTFGYEFRPWRGEPIATADRILDYLRDTAREFGIDRNIRFHHRVVGANWSGREGRWLVDVVRTDTGEPLRFAARWLFCATGYYRYDEGYTPHFEGRERFGGTIVHPQHWPADLDYAGKRVVVIGSGAPAVTLVPAMADTAAHVTMLQRSPTYVLPVPGRDVIAETLTRLLGERLGYTATRWKNILQQRTIYRFCQRFPRPARRIIRRLNAAQLPPGYPVDVHFNPRYNPWDQRLCVVPDSDLFRAIRNGRASVVTDEIVTFTETGIQLASGQHLDADIIVTATGLSLLMLGGITFSVDGAPVNLREKLVYKGMMLADVPNLAFAIGYTNASWTLKVGLVCEHLCRILRHMDLHGYEVCVPHNADPAMVTRPLLDFAAGYVQRSLDELPRQGAGAPWVQSMDYLADIRMLRRGPVTDPNLRFAHVPAPALTGTGARR